jgi:hypothetical protein
MADLDLRDAEDRSTYRLGVRKEYAAMHAKHVTVEARALTDEGLLRSPVKARRTAQ